MNGEVRSDCVVKQKFPLPTWLWKLILIGLCSIALYGFGITGRYPLMAGLQAPSGNWATLVEPNWLNLILHVGVYLLLTLFYTLAIRVIAATPAKTPQPVVAINIIILIWLIASIVLLGAYPGGDSHDVFDYLFRGRIYVEYAASPLAITPDQFPKAPYFDYISWDKHVDTYGPLWEYASASVAFILRTLLQASGVWEQIRPSCPASAGSCAILAGYITGYRLLAIALHGLSGGLIWRIVQHSNPEHAATALLIWLWNPIGLLAAALGAHNDSLMLVLLLTMFLCIQRHKWLVALLMLGLAVHVKLTALLFAPALAIWLYRKLGWWRMVWVSISACAILIPTSWLLYAPLGGWQTLPRMLYERGLYFANGPAAILYRWLYHDLHWPWPQAVGITNQSATFGFVIVLLIILWRFWHSTSHQDIPDQRFWAVQITIVLAYLIVGSFWFQHWYLVWVLVPAALVPTSRITHSVLPWYGCGALCANVVAGMLSAFPNYTINYKGYAIIATTLTLLPLIVTATWIVFQQRRQTATEPQTHYSA